MEGTSLSLLERLANNSDADSWRVLAELYTPLLEGFLRTQGLQPSDVDDVVQEVLLVVYRELPSFHHSGRIGAFRSWLRGIPVNRWRDMCRQQRYRPRVSGSTGFLELLDQLADPHGGLSRSWNQEHDRHVVFQMLKRIESRFSPTTMQAFRRIVLDKAAAGDVARELDISRNAVVIAKCRVLKELRREARGLFEA